MEGGIMSLLGFERRWLHQVLGTIFPRGTHPRLQQGIADYDLELFFDDALGRMPGRARLGLRMALWVIQVAPLFCRVAWSRFSQLDEARQLETLTRLKTSRWYLARELLMLLKAVGSLGFCGLPAVQRSVGMEQVEDTDPAWQKGEEP